jgi:Ca2+-binding EF-hand superfamily protein
MLTEETQRLLRNVLLELARGELKCEELRQRFAQFDQDQGPLIGGPYVAFQRLDRSPRDEFITPEEIIQFLRDNRVYDVTFEEAKYLVEYFDTDDDFALCYKE